MRKRKPVDGLSEGIALTLILYPKTTSKRSVYQAELRRYRQRQDCSSVCDSYPQKQTESTTLNSREKPNRISPNLLRHQSS